MESATPFALIGNHAYVRGTLHHRDDLLFIVETGAGITLVHDAVARDLGLALSDPVGGFGAGQQSSLRFAEASGLAVAGATVSRLRVGVTSLANLRAKAGQPIDVLLGADVLGRGIVDLDYEQHRVSLRPADAARDRRLTWTPFELDRNLIVLNASVTGRDGRAVTGRFVLDTGAGGESAVALSGPFTGKNGVAPTEVLEEDVSGEGFGGTMRATFGRLAALTIAGHELHHPVAMFTNASEGFFSFAEFSGVLATELLRRFHVVIDYPQRRVSLEPNSAFDEPFAYAGAAARAGR
jgi:hypothetical protein